MDPRQLESALPPVALSRSPSSDDSENEDRAVHGQTPHKPHKMREHKEERDSKDVNKENLRPDALAAKNVAHFKSVQARMSALNQLRTVLGGMMYELNTSSFDPAFGADPAYRQLHAIRFDYTATLAALEVAFMDANMAASLVQSTRQFSESILQLILDPRRAPDLKSAYTECSAIFSVVTAAYKEMEEDFHIVVGLKPQEAVSFHIPPSPKPRSKPPQASLPKGQTHSIPSSVYANHIKYCTEALPLILYSDWKALGELAMQYSNGPQFTATAEQKENTKFVANDTVKTALTEATECYGFNETQIDTGVMFFFYTLKAAEARNGEELRQKVLSFNDTVQAMSQMLDPKKSSFGISVSSSSSIKMDKEEKAANPPQPPISSLGKLNMNAARSAQKPPALGDISVLVNDEQLDTDKPAYSSPSASPR